MSSLFNLDNLCRDPESGAYHCPSCEAPFTRRSNLRRHFVIHTRSMPFKCDTCGSRFPRSDELQYHSLTCSNTSWQGTTEAGQPTMTKFPPNMVFDVMGPARPQPAPTTLAPQHHRPPVTSTPTPSTQDAAAADQAFADFMSSLTPLSPTSSDSLEAFPASFDSYGALDGILGTTNSSTTIPSPPVHQPSLSRSSRLYPRRNVQPYTTANRRKKLKEKPVYTRRQVDDMLNAVSNCFAGTMEEVLKRVNLTETQKPSPSPVKGAEAPEDPNQELRKVLSDTLPRLFQGLQNFLDERIKAD